MRLPFAALAVVGLLLAGCLDPKPAAAPVGPSEDAQFGFVSGRTLDDELSPLANVTVTIPELTAQRTTDADGGFAFGPVKVGAYTLVASHPVYVDVVQAILVETDATSTADLTLIKKPEFRPTNATVPYTGSFDCGAEAPIITGPCWTLVEGVSCAPPLNYCVHDPVFKSQYAFKFEVKPRWQTVIAELTWESGATLMDGMRLYVENANGTTAGAHAWAVAKVHGNQQPLSVRIDRGTPGPGHETYEGTSVPAYIPDEGGLQQIRVFPKGQGYQYTSQVCREGQCLLGVGAGLNVRFTVHLTIFYNEAAPTGFSAVPKA